MTIRGSLVVVFLTVLILAAVGCYTIIEHPTVVNTTESGYSYNTRIRFYDDCSSCHLKDGTPKLYYKRELADNYSSASDNEPDVLVMEDSVDFPVINYYDYSYWGGYGHYYYTPWWGELNVKTQRRNENDEKSVNNSASRDNDGGRNREDIRNNPPPLHTGTTTTGTYTGGSNNNTNNRNEERNETKTTNTRDNGGSSNNNSDEGKTQNSSRNNDGSRNTGRR